MTYHDLLTRLHDNPFKPFRIRATLNNVYDILEPWRIWVTERSAMIAFQIRRDEDGFGVPTRFKTVSIDHMIELEDLEPPKRKSKK